MATRDPWTGAPDVEDPGGTVGVAGRDRREEPPGSRGRHRVPVGLVDDGSTDCLDLPAVRAPVPSTVAAPGLGVRTPSRLTPAGVPS